MADARSGLERHVAFELARWRAEDLASVLHEELGALLDWFGDLTVADLGPADEVARTVATVVEGLPLTDETLALAGEAVAVGHQALLEHDERLADVVRRSDFDALARVLSEAEGLRGEVLDIVTGSEAYSRLVAHVLYNGVKSYVLTENFLARRIPGASSLVRLGQRGLNSAAPGLEAGVDRQLTAFVEANISETLRESRRYLESNLDERLLRDMAADAWDELSDRTLSSLAGAARPGDARELVEHGGRVLRSLRESGVLGRIAGAAAGTMLARHSSRRLDEVLAEVGLTAGHLARDLAAVLGPVLERADADGFLEARIRARLEPFYLSLPEDED